MKPPRAAAPFPLRRIAPLLVLGFAVACRGDRGPDDGGKTRTAPAAPPPVEETDVPERTRRTTGPAPVLWLALDGLDFELLDRLAAEGRMPSWKRLAAEGYTARLRSFHPLISPLLWTTIATGADPEAHGILDFQEVDPDTGRRVPISGLSRAVPAVWNLASAAGRRVGVVGWWATHPAEEVNGFFISDRATPLLFANLSLAGTSYPPSLAALVEKARGRDGDVRDEELAEFVQVPADQIARARSSGAGMEDPVVALARILGATRTAHRVARDLYDRGLPDLTVLYLQGTDEIGHAFAPYAPPRLSCVSEADAARYGGAVAAFYGVVDRMLGQWMRRAEEDGATLLVHSDHGFAWGASRPCDVSSRDWSTAVYWHRLDGVFAAWGSRVRPKKGRGEASVFDVAPTVAALLQVPAASVRKGAVLTDAFRLPPPAAGLDISRVAVRRVPAGAVSEKESDEFARKLRSLGYLSGREEAILAPTGGNRPGRTDGAWNNLGVYLRETRGDLEKAQQAFEKALAVSPGAHSPLFNLAVLHRRKGNAIEAERWLFRALEAGHPDPEGSLLRWAAEYQESDRMTAARSVLERGAVRYPQSEAIAQKMSLLRFQAKDCGGAFQALSRFEAATRSPDTLNSLALFQTCLGRREKAVALLERSLLLRPDQPGARDSLNRIRAANLGQRASR